MKIYTLPINYLFYKPFNSINLYKIRQNVINNHLKQIQKNKVLDDYVKLHTRYKIIYEWSSYSSSSSSSYVSVESVDSSWVDMKKLL